MITRRLSKCVITRLFKQYYPSLCVPNYQFTIKRYCVQRKGIYFNYVSRSSVALTSHLKFIFVHVL